MSKSSERGSGDSADDIPIGGLCLPGRSLLPGMVALHGKLLAADAIGRFPEVSANQLLASEKPAGWGGIRQAFGGAIDNLLNQA